MRPIPNFRDDISSMNSMDAAQQQRLVVGAVMRRRAVVADSVNGGASATAPAAG